MAYQQTTAADAAGVVDAIEAFADGLGFIIDFHGNTPDGRRALQFSGGGLTDYAHLYTVDANDGVFHMRSISLSSGDNYDSQSERSFRSVSNFVHTGPYANLYLFGETGANAYIHCVLEHTAGHFRHFGIGEMIKTGTWTGGGYCYGTMWNLSTVRIDVPYSFDHGRPFDGQSATSVDAGQNSSVRCDDFDGTPHGVSGIDARYLRTYASSNAGTFGAGVWYDSGTSTASNPGRQYTRAVGAYDSEHSPSYFNNRVILAPFGCLCWRASSFITYMGEPPAIRAASIEPYTPAEEFTIGTDVWKIFPLVRKGFFNDEESSNDLGIAYKKVT